MYLPSLCNHFIPSLQHHRSQFDLVASCASHTRSQKSARPARAQGLALPHVSFTSMSARGRTRDVAFCTSRRSSPFLPAVSVSNSISHPSTRPCLCLVTAQRGEVSHSVATRCCMYVYVSSHSVNSSSRIPPSCTRHEHPHRNATNACPPISVFVGTGLNVCERHSKVQGSLCRGAWRVESALRLQGVVRHSGIMRHSSASQRLSLSGRRTNERTKRPLLKLRRRR